MLIVNIEETNIPIFLFPNLIGFHYLLHGAYVFSLCQSAPCLKLSFQYYMKIKGLKAEGIHTVKGSRGLGWEKRIGHWGGGGGRGKQGCCDTCGRSGIRNPPCGRT